MGHLSTESLGRHPSRGHALGVITTLLGMSLAGCSVGSPPKPSEPNTAAAGLAAGLAQGELSTVVFDGATPADATTFVKTAVGDLKDVKRTVTVAKVAKTQGNDKKATASLTFTWDVDDSDKDWVYSTDAGLTLAADKTWHVTWSPALLAPGLTATERLTRAPTLAKRADIVGAGNTPLMTERAVFQIGIDKGRVNAGQAASSASALATLLGIDPTAYVKAVSSAGAKAFVIARTLRADDPLATSRADAIAAIPGGVRIPGKSVVGPSPTFARGLLGAVGEATGEVVQGSAGKIRPGDVVGLSGLEQRYDAQLRGTEGLKVQAVGTDASGKPSARDLFSRDPVQGKPLTITLDPQAQDAAESAVGTSTTPTALVAIRPSTGEILAAANGPAANGQPLATTGHAAPGSTFKIVTALALLRAGLAPDAVVSCTPTVVVDGRTFKNYNDYPADKLGQIPLRTAFANSCNTAFLSNNDKVSQTDLASAAASLGIGVDLDLGFPTFLGSVPDQGQGTEHAASMIGQARIEVAPMDMATVVASVMKGSVVRAKLLTDNPAAAGFPTPPKPLQPAEAQALQAMMGAVVSEGSGRVLADVGVTLAKTGTAEYGTQTPLRTHAWMVAGRGDLAVVAYVEDGVSGSQSAAPLVKAFLQAFSG